MMTNKHPLSSIHAAVMGPLERVNPKQPGEVTTSPAENALELLADVTRDDKLSGRSGYMENVVHVQQSVHSRCFPVA